MEIKKSPKADLQNKRGLLLEIGLVVALILVIAAFAYTPKEYRIEKPDLNYAPVEEEITEITRQDQKPPEPPKKVEVKVIADLLQVVTNDTKITTWISPSSTRIPKWFSRSKWSKKPSRTTSRS